MKTLLSALKTAIQTDLDYIRNADVYITPHLNLIPSAVRPPCIGIKDGKITREELAGGYLEETLTVRIVAYVQLAKEEAGIMGDGAAGRKGVLDIASDIHESLDENLLGIAGMQAAFSPSEAESEMFGGIADGLQRKIIEYQYVREVIRP